RPWSRPVGACNFLYVSTFSCLGSFCFKRRGVGTVFIAQLLGCGSNVARSLSAPGCAVRHLSGRSSLCQVFCCLIVPGAWAVAAGYARAALEGIASGSAQEG